VDKTAQGLKGNIIRKKFVLPIESWYSTFFHFYFLLIILHDVTFNVTTTIQISNFFFLFKEFYKVHDV
jgi:hypothetical protein